MMLRAPSGVQVELRLGSQRLTVVEVGGGLRSYTVAGRDVIDGYGLDEMCAGGRGQVLMPWPNRIRGGRFDFEGRSLQLPLTEPAKRNAIHGSVRWANWTVREQTAERVLMEHVLHPQPGFPFSLQLSIEYALEERGLRVRTSAHNAGPTRCPIGSGAHPYLTVGIAPIDEAALEAPGRTHLRADGRGIPIGPEPVEGTPLDLRRGSRIGDLVLDDCFTDLERDAAGLAWTHLSAPDGRPRVSLWVDGAYDYLMLFTGDTLPNRPRHSVAVEPMTCAPDAFNSGDGLLVLEPGETSTGTWGIVPEGTAPEGTAP